MTKSQSYLRTVGNPHSVITAISSGLTFPESLEVSKKIYVDAIKLFAELVAKSSTSAGLLTRIRAPGSYDADTRMSLLKLFRRCVSLVCDTETTKKISKVSTTSLIENFGHTFKDIRKLKRQFGTMDNAEITALAALLAENDNRGESGYALTGLFFEWFEKTFDGKLIIKGPRGAGADVELRTVFPEFKGSYPCDFVISDAKTNAPLAVGFARYDSTRGGSQSDDRTGGNANKVEKAKTFYQETGKTFRLIFLADGPGLTHRDTWEEACILDGMWDDNVRAATLKLAPTRITEAWLRG